MNLVDDGYYWLKLLGDSLDDNFIGRWDKSEKCFWTCGNVDPHYMNHVASYTPVCLITHEVKSYV